MRLIDADEFKKQIAGMAIVNNYPADKANKMCELIESQPTAFGLESVIAEIEEKRDYCYAEMKKEENKDIADVNHLYFEQMHYQGMAYNDCLEILASAADATNGEIGG